MLPKDLILGDWVVNKYNTTALFVCYNGDGNAYDIMIDGSKFITWPNEEWRKCNTAERKEIKRRLIMELKEKETDSTYESR